MGIWSSRWKKGDEPGLGGSYHSPAYHSYFEGYTEIKVPKKRGKGSRIVRLYTGQYFTQDLTDRQWKTNKLTCFLLMVLGAALFIVFAAADRNNNKVWFTQMPEAIVSCCFLRLLYVMFGYVFAPRSMTVGQYRSSSASIINAGRITAGAIWLSALTQVLYACMPGKEHRAAGLICGAAFGLSGMAVSMIAVKESRITYRRHEEEENVQPGGIEIQR